MHEEVLHIDQEEERKIIQRAYRQLLKSLRTQMDDQDMENVRLAYEMALKAHAKQRRKSGEPYILHPIEVARICSEEIGLGPTAVVASLLHDVVEDTEVSLDQIREFFGEKIARMVDGLTKLDGLSDVTSPQAENFKKVLRTLVDDVRVVLIKMADRLHNMRTLGSMPRHKQLKIAAETSSIYAPLAHRLGLYNLKMEFQDLVMKITEPEAYQEISQKLQETKAERTQYINEFIKPLTQALSELEFPYRIVGRAKSINSIYNKIKTKKLPFEEIYDLFAVRIIVDCPPKKEKQVCWHVYSIVTDVHTPIPERLKDWVTTPKSNGYESLHTTVIGPRGRYVEVQVRTERMDEIAERGFAAHWKYKGISPQPDVYNVWLDNVREILDNKDADALEFLSDFKTSLFNEEVYVYTPKGDMKVLPKGATALDFAFSIHSDVGYHCSAIKVNNKIVPLGYELQSGDQLTVITNKNQKPNEGWLKLCVTGKARSKIRSAVKEDRRKKGELGMEALERKLENLKAPFEENVDFLVQHFKFTSRADFYFAIAMGQFNLQQKLRHFKVEGNKLEFVPPVLSKEQEQDAAAAQAAASQAPDTRSKKRKGKGEKQVELIINGQPANDLEYSFASCCQPVQGDDIFAYLTMSSGLKIHRINCTNAEHLMSNFGHRIMKAEWASQGSGSFVAEVLITGIDTGPGVIERLTNKISTQLGLNIRSMSIEGQEGYFEGRVKLLVLNIDQLQIAIRALKNLEGVSNVYRVDARS